MSAHSTPALLLRVLAYGETSQILWFFTESHGRMNVIAKGSRRSKSGLGGSLRLFSRGTLTAYVKSGRDLQTFKDFDLERSGAGLASSVLKFGGASVLSEIVLRHTAEAPSAELFVLIDEALDRIEQAEESEVVGSTLAMAWSLVDALGYRPYLDRCPGCGRELSAGESQDAEIGRLDYGAGGVLCGGCGSEADGPRIGPGARRQLSAFLDGVVPADLSHRIAHLNLLNDFVTYHLGGARPMETIPFLRQLVPADPVEDTATDDGPTEGSPDRRSV